MSSVTLSEPETALAPTGATGLDDALRGGLPRGKTTLVIGSAGTGKTTLALQFLVRGAQYENEPGLMISFEESPDELASAATRLCGNSIPCERLQFFDGRPGVDSIENGEFDIGGLLAIVRARVKRDGIRRIVFDGLDALFALSARESFTRREFQRLLVSAQAEGLTAIVTLKPAIASAEASAGHELLEYAAHAVIRLRQQMVRGLLKRTLQIVKIRNAGYSAGEHAFLIDSRGLEVAHVSLMKAPTYLSDERVSIGVPQLDDMLAGGLLKSTVTLVTGLPGTAKSTLGGAFLFAALKRGERALLVALDEPAPQLIANMRGVGMDLEPYVLSGHLRTLSLNAGAVIADEHYLVIARELTEYGASVFVLDPVSSLEKAGGSDVAVLVVLRLAALVKEHGLTAVFTAIASTQAAELEATVSQASSIADTWIHLSYSANGGERNRTVTIVKSRGTAHSNQTREMIVSSGGIALEEVYDLEGEMLLGTSRVQRKQLERREMQMRQMRVASLLRDLEERKQHAASKLLVAQSEIRELEGRITDTVEDSELFASEDLKVKDDILSIREGGPRPLEG
jgi:circadian clock protein KaiC